MLLDDLRILARLDDFSPGIALQIRSGTDDHLAVCRKVELEQVHGGDFVPGPTLTLTRDAGQRLIDDLWHCGLRPAESLGSAGQKEALERHVADMRRVAFHVMGIG